MGSRRLRQQQEQQHPQQRPRGGTTSSSSRSSCNSVVLRGRGNRRVVFAEDDANATAAARAVETATAAAEAKGLREEEEQDDEDVKELPPFLPPPCNGEHYDRRITRSPNEVEDEKEKEERKREREEAGGVSSSSYSLVQAQGAGGRREGGEAQPKSPNDSKPSGSPSSSSSASPSSAHKWNENDDDHEDEKEGEEEEIGGGDLVGGVSHGRPSLSPHPPHSGGPRDVDLKETEKDDDKDKDKQEEDEDEEMDEEACGLPPLKEGDVLGCGVDYSTREVFFTRNGVRLPAGIDLSLVRAAFGKEKEGGREGRLFLVPLVGLHSHCEVVEANAGPAFVYQGHEVQRWPPQHAGGKEGDKEGGDQGAPTRMREEEEEGEGMMTPFPSTVTAADQLITPHPSSSASLPPSLSTRRRGRDLSSPPLSLTVKTGGVASSSSSSAFSSLLPPPSLPFPPSLVGRKTTAAVARAAAAGEKTGAPLLCFRFPLSHPRPPSLLLYLTSWKMEGK